MKILQNQLKQADYQRTCWSVAPAPDTELTPLLGFEYWEHVAKALRVGDHLEVMPEDQRWFALLVVRSKSDAGVKVGVLNHVVFDDTQKKRQAKAAAQADDGEFEVKFSGGSDKWRVLRKSDKTVVSKGHDTRETALAWVEDQTAMA